MNMILRVMSLLLAGTSLVLASSLPLMAAGPERFTSQNGVVKDSRTGLQWQLQLDSASHDYGAALAYCTALGLDGGGWRLPALKELLSIADPTRRAPAIDAQAFTGAPSAWFWTASTDARDANSSAWAVFFLDAISNTQPVSSKSRVRCVR